MSAKDYSEFRTGIGGSKFVSAVNELDEYIDSEEKRYGVLIIGADKIPKCQPEMMKAFADLKSALKRDKTEREEAYKYLKKSNKTMKKVIAKLQEEMKLCREKINDEFTNFENLNTERLLNINPKYFTVVFTEREK